MFPERLGKILSSEQLGSYSCIKDYIGCNNEYRCDLKKNCDLMIYRQFKSKNIERILEIPHPIAYINASLCIKKHWESYIQPHLNKADIKAISMITISQSNKTGRLFEFRNYSGELDVDYEEGRLLSHKSENQDKALQATTINELSLNARYLVKTDISQCYPSMYTHSIPWVAVDIVRAKNTRMEKGLWYNQLDEKIRKMQRAETSGIPIGSDVSGIVAEIILAKIDSELIDFKYIRHIDDYKCYCKTREEADLFIATLSKTLHKYKMNLNDKKTMILELPQPDTEKYIRRLRSLSKKVGKNIHSKNIGEWQSFVDEAIEHSKSTNDSNALRFLFSVISTAKADKGNASSFNLIFLRLLGLCHHYYNLLEKLILFVENNKIFVDDNIKSLMTEAMEQIITKCNSSQKSEPVVWAFYLAIRYNLKIEFDDEKLLDSEDYLPILMGYLYRYMKAENADNTDKYLALAKQNKPSAWLFNYQICFLSAQNAQCLEEFREKKISFLNKDLEKMIVEHREQNNINLLGV